MTEDDLAGALREVLTAVLGFPSRIEGLRSLSGGASRGSWSFDALGADGGRRPLILQRERPGEETRGAAMSLQARMLRAATRAGVPVPAVVVSDEDLPQEQPALGRFMVVERLEGETIARKILRDDAFTAARERLTGQCAHALAGIHSIPVDELPELERGDQLQKWRTVFDQLGQPHPAFELALRWLDANRPPTDRETVVHGDFRNGNLVVGPDGLRAVLDWELVHAGDPMEDLGWLCVKAWRFGERPPVGGFGDYAELFSAYESETGRAVDPEVVRWWEVFGTLRWGIICIAQAFRHLSGATRSVELATIGRRVCENEHDLLMMLSKDPASSSETPPARGYEGTLHDAPSVPELLEAVREFLERDVMAATEGTVRFHARVAANAVAIVERELALGPSQAEAHRARLAALGVADEAELASAIRSGALDHRRDEVLRAVQETIRDKLLVANPSYLG